MSLTSLNSPSRLTKSLMSILSIAIELKIECSIQGHLKRTLRAEAEGKGIEGMPLLDNNPLAGIDGGTTVVDDGVELLIAIAGAAEEGEIDGHCRASKRSIN
jgi:hypothetical protein